MGPGVPELIVIAATVIVVGVLVPIWSWMIDDCLKYHRAGSRRRTLWLAAILFTGPVGALAYFVVVRRRRVARSAREG